MRTLTITVTSEQAGRSVHSLLRRELGMPEGFISALKFRETGVCLNGARCRTTATVRAGDILTAEIGDKPAESGIVPIPYPLTIPYEDDDLLLLDKPAGMATHGKAEKGGVTAAAALAAYWGTDRAFHPVNRLDRGTSGLMAVAKSGFVHEKLRRALHTPEFCREYLAICAGTPPGSAGSITLPLEKDPDAKNRIRVSETGRPARTDYELVGTRGGLSLVRARLLTGRTHQIRVHLAALGCPLAGDVFYGGPPLIARPALHSHRLALRQPVTGERIERTSPMPEDMETLWKSIR